MRVFHVILLGCVPVIVQDDGKHPPVRQAFEPQLLNWGRFAVVVAHDQARPPARPAPIQRLMDSE